jgi:phosphoenolpyruvate carboxykinase (GTP)
MSETDFEALTQVDGTAWRSEIELHAEWFAKLDRIPEPLRLKQQLLSLRVPQTASR